jgi:outer membrane lipoprotein-sorting protein
MNLVQRMSRAERTQAYLAREVVQERNGRQERWVKHDPKRGTRRESVTPGGEVLIDNHKRSWVFLPREKRFLERESEQPRLRQIEETTLRRLRTGEWEVVLQGTDQIAGRPALVVRLQPKRGSEAPSYRLWLDKETGLRLRWEQQDADGRILFTAYYVSLDLAPRFEDSDFQPPKDTAPIKRPRQRFRTADEAQKAGYPVRLPTEMPGEYRLQEISVFGKGEQVRSSWSSGMNVVTLAQWRLSTVPAGLRRQITTAPTFLAGKNNVRPYAWVSGEFAFVLIANLPEDQLKRIADSVK